MPNWLQEKVKQVRTQGERRRRLVVPLATGLIVVTSFLSPAKASSWLPPLVSTPDTTGVSLVDSFYNTGQNVSRVVSYEENTTRFGSQHLCVKFGQSPCNDSNLDYIAVVLLPTCVTSSDEWCIENIAIHAIDEPLVPATFIKSVNGGSTPGNNQADLPSGGSMGLWKAAGHVNTGGTDTYAGFAALDVYMAKNSTKFLIGNFTAMVLPYSDKQGAYQKAVAHDTSIGNGISSVALVGTVPGCVWTEDGICGLIQDFPNGVKAEMKIRIGKDLTGWLMGRMQNVDVSVENYSNTQNILTIDAEPVIIPKLYITAKNNEVTPEIVALPLNLLPGTFGAITLLANTPLAFEEINAWSGLAKNTASGLASTWSATTVPAGSGSPCLSDTSKIQGIVTTNAMAYDGGSPEFKEGTLNYRVAGYHYNPDGSIFQGRYDLVMRSDAARCLYGFTKAPIAATISVIDANGTSEVAVTNLSDDGTWLHLSATGFTFSSPTLKIKLSQSTPAPVVSVPTPISRVAGTVIKKPSIKRFAITCFKPHFSTKVFGKNPRCPAGYKKMPWSR